MVVYLSNLLNPLDSMHCNMLPVTGWNCLGIIDPRAPDCKGENVFLI